MGWLGKEDMQEYEKEGDDKSEDVSYDEIIEALNVADEEDDDENEEMNTAKKDEQDDSEEQEEKNEISVSETVSDIDALCDFVNKKAVGAIQYMRKSDSGSYEVFQIKEVHLRIARVWGSVSMAREYSERDFARIMLAIEIIDAPDDFYVLPYFTEEEKTAAIIEFCEKEYNLNGKKYAKNTKKFAKLIKKNDATEEWLAFTGELVRVKVEEFCGNNGIEFKK